MKKWLLFPFIIGCQIMMAQGTYTSNNDHIEQLLDRIEIKHGSNLPYFYTGIKSYSKKDVAIFIDSSYALSKDWSAIELFDLEYLTKENAEYMNRQPTSKLKKILLNGLFENEANFWQLKTTDFFMKINPILAVSLGKEKENSNSLYNNSRGIEISGSIMKNVGFYFNITENQSRFMNYISQYAHGHFGQNNYNALPRYGYWKEFGTNGYDYFNTIGYVDFTIPKYFSISFGNDKNFYGYGYRSLFLSDQSAPYLNLKVNLKIWKLHYQVMFNEMTSQYLRGGDTLLPRKYGAFHLLTFKASKHIEIGLFESVVFQRNSGFDMQYLNPVIFYRSLEQSLGSNDNSLMGVQYRVNFLKSMQSYGQLIIDDLSLSQWKNGNSWWGNKYGIQLGYKYIDVAKMKNLDLQVEWNYVRPYTYTHSVGNSLVTMTNYTHYNQELAHPLGANFSEFLLKLTYRPIPRLNLEMTCMHSDRGADSSGISYGSDVFYNANGNNIPKENGVMMLQGAKTSLNILNFYASYMPWHNLFLEMNMMYRNSSSPLGYLNQSTVGITAGFRWNFARRQNLF